MMILDLSIDKKDVQRNCSLNQKLMTENKAFERFWFIDEHIFPAMADVNR